MNFEFIYENMSTFSTERGDCALKVFPLLVSNMKSLGCSVLVSVYPQTDVSDFFIRAKVTSSVDSE